MKFNFLRLKVKLEGLFKKAPVAETSHIALPERDWHRLLLSFLVLCIISVGLHYWFFRALEDAANEAPAPKVTATSTGKILKKKQLEQISQEMRNKEALLKALEETRPLSIDPH